MASRALQASSGSRLIAQTQVRVGERLPVGAILPIEQVVPVKALVVGDPAPDADSRAQRGDAQLPAQVAQSFLGFCAGDVAPGAPVAGETAVGIEYRPAGNAIPVDLASVVANPVFQVAERSMRRKIGAVLVPLPLRGMIGSSQRVEPMMLAGANASMAPSAVCSVKRSCASCPRSSRRRCRPVRESAPRCAPGSRWHAAGSAGAGGRAGKSSRPSEPLASSIDRARTIAGRSEPSTRMVASRRR